KNRQRWTFGGLYPREYSLAQGGTDAWSLQTECLIVGERAGRAASQEPRLTVKVRFLHLLARQVGQVVDPSASNDEGAPPIRAVDALWIGDRLYQSWQEAIERVVAVDDLEVDDLVARPYRQTFTFPSSRKVEQL